MQFHLNGFKPGNPEISEPAEQYECVTARRMLSPRKSMS